MCSKKCIIACARYCMCLKNFIIACARYYIVPEETHHCMCQQSMCPKKCIIALCPRLHCARNLHKPKTASCSKFACARIKSTHKYQQMPKKRYALFTHYLYSEGVILQRHYLSWPEDFISRPKGLFYAYYVPKASSSWPT